DLPDQVYSRYRDEQNEETSLIDRYEFIHVSRQVVRIAEEWRKDQLSTVLFVKRHSHERIINGDVKEPSVHEIINRLHVVVLFLVHRHETVMLFGQMIIGPDRCHDLQHVTQSNSDDYGARDQKGSDAAPQ